MRAEPDDRHDPQQREHPQRARCHARALAPARGREHHEWEHQPSRCLYAHAHDEHGARGAETGDCTCREREGARQDEQNEGVVVCAAARQLEQNGVQAHEHGRRPRRATHPARRLRRERDRTEARGHGDRLERPQAAGQAQRRQGIGAEREQGTIRGMLEGPADEREDGIGGGFGGHVGVGIQPVQDAQARKGQVAEHVLGDQRRPQRQQHVSSHDRERDRPAREQSRGKEDGEIARAHDEREHLKAGGPEPEPERVQWPRQPSGPATAAGGHIGCGLARGARHDAEHARRHTHQSHHTEHPQCKRKTHDEAARAASVRCARYAFHVAVH